METKEFSLSELAQQVNGEIRGDADYRISGLATLHSATENHLSFLANPAYEKQLASTQAGAVILNQEAAQAYSGNVLLHSNPYLAYAQLSHLWSPFGQSSQSSFLDPSAQIHASASLGKNVCVAAGAVIGKGAVIESGVRIGENCVIGEGSVVGSDSILHANVTLYHGVSLGSECIVHSGVVIGSDGFGFAPGPEGWSKIAQLGGVQIGKRVEIGANTTIDRGALDDTKIGDGVILDNQIQIAHNVVIGENTAIAACSAIAGSTTLGKNVIVGGASGIAGHLQIADGVHITAMTMVIKSLNEPGVYSSGTGVQPNDKWRKSIARLRQLDKMAQRLSAVEKKLKNSDEAL